MVKWARKLYKCIEMLFWFASDIFQAMVRSSVRAEWLTPCFSHVSPRPIDYGLQIFVRTILLAIEYDLLFRCKMVAGGLWPPHVSNQICFSCSICVNGVLVRVLEPQKRFANA